MNELKIAVGDLDVYASGTVMGFGDCPIVFRIGDDGLIFRLLFANDSSGKMFLRSSIPEGSERELHITLVNFTAGLGSGTEKPLVVGSLEGRLLLFYFWIHSHVFAQTVRVVHYTFFLGDPSDS